MTAISFVALAAFGPTAFVALGPTAFAALVWGSVVLVLAVFGYVAGTYVREL